MALGRPGDHPERETTLEPGELITAVDIPPLGFATSAAVELIGRRVTRWLPRGDGKTR